MDKLTSSALFIVLAVLCIQHTGNAQDICIIVNQENPVSALTNSQAKLIYLRKINKRWKELNKNVIPVDRKGETETRKKFLKEILQFTSDEFARYFTEREYQNAEAPPVKFTSDDDILAFVEENPGAIAYWSRNAIKSGSRVKVILTF